MSSSSLGIHIATTITATVLLTMGFWLWWWDLAASPHPWGYTSIVIPCDPVQPEVWLICPPTLLVIIPSEGPSSTLDLPVLGSWSNTRHPKIHQSASDNFLLPPGKKYGLLSSHSSLSTKHDHQPTSKSKIASIKIHHSYWFLISEYIYVFIVK